MRNLQQTIYRTLFWIGELAWLDAKCETRLDGTDRDECFYHGVEFVLVTKFGDAVKLDICILTQFDMNEPEIMDEDGNTFPCLDDAIRAYASGLVSVTPMPGKLATKPPRRELYDGSFGAAWSTCAI